MKFILSLALLAAAGVSAQSSTDDGPAAPSSTGCDADYIVTRCLETENTKASDCKTTDYDCLCDAYQAIATCYNNCPNDPRVGTAESQVKIYCQNASLYGTRTVAKATSTASTDSDSEATETSDATATDEDSTATATKSAAATHSSNSAADLARNTGGILLAVAGVVAAML
ncbi:hypothetical protein BGZ63DRAFT_216429 [Mariannaea sp. PMI_226]|nr:hypothetical protein BGZ63DRAFT_216429 [Mariannaea sp. PMI_226]